jgi:dihydropteroate synthase
MVLNCNGISLNLSTPKIMGVININADSFYSGSRSLDLDSLEQKAIKMINDGASIIDIGVMSSRPGAKLIEAKEEIEKLSPVINLLTQLDIIISVDTVWSKTAEHAINNGVHMINDISGGSLDEKMMEVLGSAKNIPLVLMHMIGIPETMQQNTKYQNLLLDMINYFSIKIRKAKNFGIKDLLIDPGFGFSKTLDQNYTLLNKLNLLCIFDLPILVGLSRKSMLYKTLGVTPEDALNATTSANTIALMNGAKILRVHDVKEAVEAVKIFNITTSS